MNDADETDFIDVGDLTGEDLERLDALLTDESSQVTFPITAAQADILEVAQSYPQTTSAGIHLAIRIDGRISLQRLYAAHEALSMRHSALRTTFAVKDGSWVQTVSSSANPLRMTTREQIGDDLVRDVLERHRTQGFAATHGGALAHTEVLTTRDNRHLLVWSFHHSVVDGYSLGIIWDDLVALYNGREIGPAPEPFNEFARWQREWLDTDAARSQLSRLVQRTPLPAPTITNSRASTSRPDPEIGSLTVAIGSDTLRAVMGFATAADVSLHMLLVAIYREAAEAVGVLESAAPIWTPLAARTSTRFTRTVGMLANALPIYGRPAQAADLRTALGDVRTDCLLAIESQQLPRRNLLRERPDIPSDALLALQNTPSGTQSMIDAEAAVVRPSGWPPVAPILEFYSPLTGLFRTAMSFAFRDDGLVGVLEYDQARVSPTVAQELLAKATSAIEALASRSNPWS
jgi:hypothetical protein